MYLKLIQSSERVSLYSIHYLTGDDGVGGEGGSSGDDSRRGFIIDVVYLDVYNTRVDPYDDDAFKAGKPSPSSKIPKNESGYDGIGDHNQVGIEYPDAVNLINPSHVINNFKSFVMKNLASGGHNSNLSKFVQDMDYNYRIQWLYNTSGLVDEMLMIEMKYFELKDKIPLTPYFTSLLKRTTQHAQNFTESIENKDALRWLYTTLMIRFRALGNPTTPIFNLPEYLDDIEAHISKLRHNEMEINVKEQQYSLNSEIRSVTAFVKKQILPEFQNILVEISSHVTSLMEELFERQYKFDDKSLNSTNTSNSDNNDSDEDDSDAIFSLIMMPRDKIFLYKVLNSIAAFDPTAVGSLMMIETENEILKKSMSNSNYFTSDLCSELTESTLVTKMEKFQLLQEELLEIEYELDQFAVSKKLKNEPNELLNVTKKVSELNFELSQYVENDLLVSNDFDWKRDVSISHIEKKQSKVQLLKNLSTLFNNIAAVLGVTGIPLNYYEQLSVESITELIDFFETTEQMQEDAINSTPVIEYIYDTILKRFLELESIVNEISHIFNETSHIELEGSKWRTLNAVRYVEAFFRKFSNETAVKELMYRSFKKLDDHIVSLFDAHDYIDHLNKLKSINGFGEFNSGKLSHSLDNALNDTIVNLKKIIRMNIVLEKYELAVKAFKQHQFPFGNEIAASVLDLPTNLQPDNNERLVEVVIDRIDYLRDIVKSGDMSIGKYSHLVFSDVDFSSDGLAGPFYIWNSSEIRHEWTKLLAGEEILLKADINKAKPFNAVKFNKIGIKVITENEVTKDFESELEKSILTMTMTEKSDYRCAANIHSITVKGSISFSYSFKHNSNGEPVMKNEVYRQLQEHDYFLSPYTTWKIKLENEMNLKRFGVVPVGLELYGRGKYVRNSDIISEICNKLK